MSIQIYISKIKVTVAMSMNTFADAFGSDISSDTSSEIEMDIDEPMTRTDNGMKTRVNTGSLVLDYFGKAGSSRGTDISSYFMDALEEDEDLAIRALQWTRDIREGAGEREQFRSILKKLDQKDPAIAARLIPKIPILGRFDDLFSYENPVSRKLAFEFIKESLEGKSGLCAKWMPRKGKVAVELTKFLGLSPKQYRRLIVDLTDVVETQMCAKDWDKINFSQVPSVASARYQKAFGRNAKDKYTTYLEELEKPESERDPSVKINAGAVYPYDVCKSVTTGNSRAADAQWEALPNFIGDSKIIPMVDVSGSMTCNMSGKGPTPLEIAVSLGLYVSEKNTSVFKDTFLTFSQTPEMVRVSGTLSQRIHDMTASGWGMNTDLNKAFDEILRVAKLGKLIQKHMPEMFLILSDMQFDECVTGTGYDDTSLEMIKRKFDLAGYKMPKVVYWNLSCGSGKSSPVRFDDNGVCHISGFSPAIMKYVLADDLGDFTPLNVMLQALNVDRYDLM